MGFEGTHKVVSSTKAMFQPMETSFKKTQELKTQGKPFGNHGKSLIMQRSCRRRRN